MQARTGVWWVIFVYVRVEKSDSIFRMLTYGVRTPPLVPTRSSSYDTTTSGLHFVMRLEFFGHMDLTI